MFKRGVKLKNIIIAAPCPVSWNSMKGNDRQRHCSSCSSNVYNVSEMSVQEVEFLLANAKEKQVCLQIFRRADGTIMTNDCPIGRRSRGIKATVISFFNRLSGASKDSLGSKPSNGGLVPTASRGWRGRIAFDDAERHKSLLRLLQTEPELADHEAYLFYQQALLFQQSEDESMRVLAQDSYKRALNLIRADFKKYDPKMTQLIVRDYAALLWDKKDFFRAIAIRNEFSWRGK